MQSGNVGALCCERCDDSFGYGHCLRDGNAVALGASELDMAQYVLGGLFTQTRESGKPAVPGSDLQLGDGGDIQFLPHSDRCLGAKPGNLHQFEHTIGKLGLEPLEVFETAGIDQFGDLLRYGFANARDFLKVFLIAHHLLKLRGQTLDGAGGSLVGANRERRLGLHLQEASDVFEYFGYLRVSHGYADSKTAAAYPLLGFGVRFCSF